MKLSTFAKALNRYVEAGHGSDKVIVELDNGVSGDIEADEITADVVMARPAKTGKAILIQTDTKIIPKEKDRDKPKFAEERTPEDDKSDGKTAKKKNPVFVCPDCGLVLRKTDKFCSRCGRKVAFRTAKQ